MTQLQFKFDSPPFALGVGQVGNLPSQLSHHRTGAIHHTTPQKKNSAQTAHSPHFTLALIGISTLLILASTAHPAVAQNPTVTPVPPSPTPALSPTPTLEDRYGETILSDIIAPLIILFVGGILGTIGTIFFKPRIEHWAKRRKLRLQEKERERQVQQQAVQRRQIEDQRLRAYLSRVADLYNITRIFVQKEDISLEEIYTDVYILDRPQAFRRFDITQLKADPGLPERADRQHGREFLTQPDAHRLFILGKPGAGKTTFLRYLARQAATGAIERIPIFITLREWADVDQRSRDEGEGGVNLLTFIVSQFELCNFPDAAPFVEHLLEERNDALVLFDGLDEIRHEGDQRRHAIAALRDFARRYERAQVLITCRVAATDYSFEGFTYVEIADFTDDQIRTFASRYFRHSPQTSDLFFQELNKDEQRGLRELARTPLLLGLLCLSFEETLAFPRHRDEIYTEALDALLKKWDAKRAIRRDQIYSDLSLKHKRGLLAHLAYHTFELGDYFLPQRDLETRIVTYLTNLPVKDVAWSLDSEVDGEAVLRAIESQHGILIERAHRIHSFAHLTFQEYYTARYIIENVDSGTLPQLFSHAVDDRWREVILLTAAMLSNADSFFEYFCLALELIVLGDEGLSAFLAWVARKAAAVQTDYPPVFLRSCYCYLDFDLGHAPPLYRALFRNLGNDALYDLILNFARIRERVHARDLVRAFDHARDIGRDIGRAFGRNLDYSYGQPFSLGSVIDRALGRDLAFILDRTLAHAHALARSFAPDSGHLFLGSDPARDFDRALDRARNYAQRLGLDTLYQALSALALPAEDTSAEDWHVFADHLQEIMIEHRDIGHDWNFTEEQAQRLKLYFYATELLVQCLNLAVVTDRAAIENRLLVPPGWDEDQVKQEQEQAP